MTDEELSELFRSSYPRLYRLAYSILNDQEESKDVVSSIFTELLDKHILARDTKTYLNSMVRNRSIDILRRRQLKDDVQATFLQEYEQCTTDDTHEDEQINEIRIFIEKGLTPQTRRVLQLCYDDKKSYKEVSSELGISVQAVNKHISQALRKLRERFCPSIAIIFAASCIAIAAIINHSVIISDEINGNFTENTFTTKQNNAQAVPVDTTLTMSRIVAFDKAELCEIMDSINNIYNVDVVYNNEAVKHLHLHFQFDTNNLLSDVIHNLNMFEKINIKEKDGTLEVE